MSTKRSTGRSAGIGQRFLPGVPQPDAPLLSATTPLLRSERHAGFERIDARSENREHWESSPSQIPEVKALKPHLGLNANSKVQHKIEMHKIFSPKLTPTSPPGPDLPDPLPPEQPAAPGRPPTPPGPKHVPPGPVPEPPFPEPPETSPLPT